MQIYRVSSSLLGFIYTLLTVMTLGGAAVFILGVALTAGGPPAWFMFLWLGMLAWVWYAYLSVPYRIVVRDDHSLEFQSLLGCTTLNPHDLVSIRGVFLSPGFIKVKHTRGTLLLMGQMTGLHELIAHIREANPEVAVSGC